MDAALIVSPHLDDAVLSCGQFMAGRPECVVATVFTATPHRSSFTSYDRNCGFSSGPDAMRARRHEDANALSLLNATPMHLGFLDHQYTPGQRPDLQAIAAAVAELVEQVRPERILWPVGLGHPDHKLVAAAGRMVCSVQSWVYEELPYRVLFPLEVAPALAQWNPMADEPEFIGTGDQQAKENAVSCYRSQLWALDRHAVLCPERYWRVA